MQHEVKDNHQFKTNMLKLAHDKHGSTVKVYIYFSHSKSGILLNITMPLIHSCFSSVECRYIWHSMINT